MSLNGSDDIALNAAHTHTQRQQLHGKGLACAAGAEQVQVGVFIFLRVKQIDDAQRIVMTIDSEQHAGIVRHLKGCEHIGRGRAAGQHIPLGFLFKLSIRDRVRTDLRRTDVAQAADDRYAQVYGYVCQ